MSRTIGVDEAGRGPLAGPVVAGAVWLGPDGGPGRAIAGLNDSKKLSARRRAALEEQIKAHCLWGVGVVEPGEIDRINIFAATMLAMTRAVAGLAQAMAAGGHGDVAMALIDGNKTPQGRVADWRWPARAIVGGDASEPAISAASIIAKEHRDAIMRDLDARFPQYGWVRNAGYGTAQHLAALREHGPCEHHRRSFAPVAQLSLL
ncbi:MAG TPA: ribonuclease HII [Novosphingobium sp.]|nr:ribonuclease HII [Novosphingobium sp.]